MQLFIGKIKENTGTWNYGKLKQMISGVTFKNEKENGKPANNLKKIVITNKYLFFFLYLKYSLITKLQIDVQMLMFYKINKLILLIYIYFLIKV